MALLTRKLRPNRPPGLWQETASRVQGKVLPRIGEEMGEVEGTDSKLNCHYSVVIDIGASTSGHL